MSSGRKSISTYYAKAVAKTILTCAFFRFQPIRGLQPVTAHGHDFAMRDFLTEQLR